MDYIEGYDRAFLIDSVCSKGKPPGSVLSLSLEDFGAAKSRAPHFSGVVEAMALMKELRMKLPDLCIIGVNVEDTYAFREGLSAGLGRLTDAISRDVYARIVARLGRNEVR